MAGSRCGVERHRHRWIARQAADCRSTDPRKSELYVVEGDSAGGSAKKQSRFDVPGDTSLHGKIINVEKARIDHRVLKEHRSSGDHHGAGHPSRRVHDIGSCAYKIVRWPTPMLTATYFHAVVDVVVPVQPAALENRHVFLAQPPLYKLKQRSDEFAYSDRRHDGLLEAGLKAGKKINKEDGIQRYKGLE